MFINKCLLPHSGCTADLFVNILVSSSSI